MKDELFNELIASVREGGKILRGKAKASRSFTVATPNVRKIRANYKMIQNEFAALLGISVKTLRNWEQGRRAPEGAARVVLQHPDVIWARREGQINSDIK